MQGDPLSNQTSFLLVIAQMNNKFLENYRVLYKVPFATSSGLPLNLLFISLQTRGMTTNIEAQTRNLLEPYVENPTKE